MSTTKQPYRNGTQGVKVPGGRNGRKSRPPVPSEYVWLDGELVPFEEATVHFLNPTMHYGPGVFEGIRCYATVRGPAVFRLREHLERFLNSIRALGVVELVYSLSDLQEAVHRTVCANSFNECYIRPLLYFDGPLGLNLDAYRPVVAIAAWKWEAFLGQAALETGVRMMISSVTRLHPNSSLTKAKVSGQYVNAVLAKTLAVRAGFDEAIMLDPEGYVAECTGENLLLVRDGVVYTTPRAAILEGITRDTLLTLASDAGYQVVEERISRDQLYIADEVFVCGTAAEVIPVREIDFRLIGDGRPGPVTRALQQLFFATVHGQTERSRIWLDYMAVAAIV
jgi:branched-chain amino acid aminotransferase